MTWTCLPYIYSPAQEEESLRTCCSDTFQSELARSKNIPEKFYSKDNLTEFYRHFPFGMTSKHSSKATPKLQISLEEQRRYPRNSSLLAGSLNFAKTFPVQEKASESKGVDQDFGKKWQELFLKYDLDLHSWKTHRCLLNEVLPSFLVTLPKWGMMRNGVCWERTMSGRRTKEIASGFSENWPTPVCMDNLPPKSKEALKKEATVARPGRSKPANLRDCVHPKSMRMWPTPTRRDFKGKNAPDGLLRKDGKSRMDQLPNAVQYPTPRADEPGRTTEGYGRGLKELIEGKDQLLGGKKTRRTCASAIAAKMSMKTVANIKNPKRNLEEHVYETLEEKKGQLNPNWVEWLMNWPICWTSLRGRISNGHFKFWEEASTKTVPYTKEMRDMSSNKKSAQTSQRSKRNEQQKGKRANSLRKMPRSTPRKRSMEGAFKKEDLSSLQEEVYVQKVTGEVLQSELCKSLSMGKKTTIPRVSQEIKDRVNRLKAIGNGQVPASAAEAFRILSSSL